MTAYISDKPIAQATAWRRVELTASVVPNRMNITFLDGPYAGQQLSIQPDGHEAPPPHGSDGLWEQGTVYGTRIVYDYDGLVAPVVYDLIGG